VKLSAWKQGKPVHHKPLRSFAELCEELGVSQAVMRGCMNKPGAPKPKLQNLSTNTPSASWYDPDEFRAWWTSRK